MAEMVERVARALVSNFDELSEKLKSDYRGDALRCIFAMREPTDKMIIAGTQTFSPPDNASAEESYKAMINEALKD